MKKTAHFEDSDLSTIKNKGKKGKNQEKYDETSKETLSPQFFKPTLSDDQDSAGSRSRVQQAFANDQEKQRRNAALNDHTNNWQDPRQTPKLGEKTETQHYNEKLSNINLTHSIPFSAVFPKAIEKSQTTATESRKFKIFPQSGNLKFQLPTLDQYYTKNKLEHSMNVSMGLNDQASMNRQMEGSSYSFLGFRNCENKLGKKSTMGATMGQTMNMDRSRNGMNLGFGKASKLVSRSTYNNYKDEIKELSFEDEDQKSQKTIEKPSTAKDYQVKGVYLLLGFLLSIIIMILIRNFT